MKIPKYVFKVRRIIRLFDEIAETLALVTAALEDRKLSDEEILKIRKQLADLVDRIRDI